MKNFSEKITITGGKYRGRKISTPGGKTHPMGSRERLALFNMIGERCEGATVLDAFAGSGALGVEALSRGATSVIFVEKSSEAVRVIKENLAALGASDSKVIKGALPLMDWGGLGDFDVILADPPYDDFGAINLEFLSGLLEKEGILALSHPGEAPELQGLKLLKTHVYAAAHLSIYIKN